LDLRINDAAEWVLARKASSVAIQLPEGLKIRATEIADELSSKADVPVVIIGDPCYGACDVRINYREIASVLIHFGHSRMPSVTDDGNILFVEVSANADVKGMGTTADRLPKNIGLLASVQYTGLLNDVKKVLEGCGKKVSIGTGDKRLSYPGQILGCNCSSAVSVVNEVDCFLYIGEGDFHPLAAAFGIKKDIFILNPMTNELRSLNETRDRMLRKRHAATESARSANSFLVIVSTKAGQRRDDVADDIIKKITSVGKKAYKAIMEEISPDALLSYRVDAYISTACPRLATDDSVRYKRPMLTPQEAEISIGLRKWENYEFDEIREKP